MPSSLSGERMRLTGHTVQQPEGVACLICPGHCSPSPVGLGSARLLQVQLVTALAGEKLCVNAGYSFSLNRKRKRLTGYSSSNLMGGILDILSRPLFSQSCGVELGSPPAGAARDCIDW